MANGSALRTDVARRNRLVMDNKRTADIIAGRNSFRSWGRKVGLLQEDLRQDAFEGLVEAAKRFDENRGVEFNTYGVYWARSKITADIFHNRLFSGLKLREAASIPVHSFEQPQTEDDTPYVEKISAPQKDHENEIDIEKLLTILREIVGRFKERQRFVVQARFFLKNQMSRSEIGTKLGVSRERVRQMELKALKDIRKELVRMGIYSECLSLVNEEYDSFI